MRLAVTTLILIPIPNLMNRLTLNIILHEMESLFGPILEVWWFNLTIPNKCNLTYIKEATDPKLSLLEQNVTSKTGLKIQFYLL